MAFVYMLLALLMGRLIGPWYIKMLGKLKMGQYIRTAGPSSHAHKSGTPTMGAGIFLIPVIILSFIILDLKDITSWLIIVAMILFAVIGGIDDFAKLLKKQNEGLTSKQKFIAQLVVAVGLVTTYILTIGDTTIWVPLVDKTFDLGWFYLVFMVFVIVGASNATNLCDGLDGLLTSNAIVTLIGFGVVSMILENENLHNFSMMGVGALAAFLIFNFNPAKVFMGDMGSLSLGALFALMTMVLKVEILLVFLGAIYVIETLSVIIQVASFKLFGRRVFKMSPIHHHFEMSNMKEKEIVYMFSAIQFVAVIVAVLMVAGI